MSTNHFLTHDICPRHPELDGLRRVQDRRCVGCHRDERLTGAERKRQRDREDRIRIGFAQRSAETVLSNIAIEYAMREGLNPSFWRAHVAAAVPLVESYRLRLCPDAAPLDDDAIRSVVWSYSRYATA